MLQKRNFFVCAIVVFHSFCVSMKKGKYEERD